MATTMKLVTKRRKRLGRGYGSGKGGHTVGRGQKGQKVRGKIGVLFEGLKVRKSAVKRLPLLRGKGKFKAGKKPVPVKISALNVFSAGSIVDLKALVKKGLVDGSELKERGVKIVGGGKLEKKLILKVPATKSVREKLKSLEGKSN